MFDELKEKHCTNCDLYKGCKTPDMSPIGPDDAEIYILGEGPSERDDLMGRPFKGQSGEILNYILEYLKLNPEKIRFNNAVNCKIKKDGATELQINACRPKVFDDIRKVKPKIIIAMGNIAIKTLFNRSEPGIHGWRGLFIPMQEFNCWVLPVYPMSKILKDGVSDNNYQWVKGTNHTDTLRVLKEDLSIIPDLINIPLPKVKSYKIVHLLKFDEVMKFFDMANKKDFFVFDYETIGLKPYFEESCILTSSFTFDGETVYVLPISYYYYLDKKKYWNSAQEQTILNKLRELLTNPNSRKGMHNSVFEMEWSKAILGIDIVNVEDSMLQKYILDCRNGTSSLDFLAFVNYGITWKIYPDSIMSNLTQLPLPELLDYNGKDSIFEYRLFKLQETALNKNKVLNEVYYEQVETAITIADIQYKGACTNEQSRDNLLKGYVIHRKNLEQEILNLDSVKEFRAKYGKVPALKSNSKDIPAILFKIEGLDSFKKTDKGNCSVDKEVLMQYASKSEFCELLLKFREYSGIEGKILKSYTECVFPDGKYHTNFYPIETGRLGSSNINLQNLDKRKHPEIRQIIVAPDGYVLIIFDYAQLEARVLAALSNCRNLIDAIKTGYDIHLAKTYEIWGEDFIKKLSPKEIKARRYKTKNEYVFPSFYGAKPKSVAKWLDISETHAQNLQDKLWSDFPEIKEWQNRLLKIYEKKRYVEIPPGRRRYAPLTVNEILNTPVQGGAASIVSKVMNKIRKRGYWVYLNCHDELVTCVKERQAKHSMQEIQGIMQIKQYDFMGDTPLVVEGSVGFDWYNTFPNTEIF